MLELQGLSFLTPGITLRDLAFSIQKRKKNVRHRKPAGVKLNMSRAQNLLL